MKVVVFILIYSAIDDAMFFDTGLVDDDLKTAVDGADETVVIDRVVIDGVAVVTVDDEAVVVVMVIRAAVNEAVVVEAVVINVTIFTEEIVTNEVFYDSAFLVDGSVDKDIFGGVTGTEEMMREISSVQIS
ncbi:hypothetical protein NDU88_005216 [Pleurodeles waltl]|uniref:Uncharacterized protein n=1 Tax=Pleurodeles waltl TaxID=8319 RepID=A0AAV7TTQ3_PLEWA|nr:hypothetical protein NDU88_005216 [Pleurodeles waltl]